MTNTRSIRPAVRQSKMETLLLTTNQQTEQKTLDGNCKPCRANRTLQFLRAIITCILFLSIIPTQPADAFENAAVRHAGTRSSFAPYEETWPIHSHIRITDPIDTLIDETPAFAEQLLWVFVDLFSQRQYEQAERVARRLVELLPDYEQPRYNLACVLAREQRVDEAFEALEAAVDRNWRHLHHMRIDPDLVLLRCDSRFADIEQRVISDKRIDKNRFNNLQVKNKHHWPQEIQTLAPQIIQQFHVPGMSVALVHDGEVTWSGSFGVADRESQKPVTGQTLFAVQAPYDLLASIAMASQNDVSLIECAAAFQEIEIQNLHNHGFSRSIQQVSVRHQSSFEAQRKISPDRFIQQQIMFLEVFANNTFSEWCRTQLLKPWNLSSIRVVDQSADINVKPHTDDVGVIATGHSQLGTPVRKLGVKQPATPTVISTSRDLARLLSLILKSTQSGSVKQIPSRITEQLYQAAQHYPDTFRHQVATDEHGLVVRVQLTSNLFGSGCLMRWYPQANCGIVVLYNGELGSIAAIRLANQTMGDIR